MTTTDKPAYALDKPEPIEGLTVHTTRETSQVPDYVMRRPTSVGDRFFVALGDVNNGYVFRVRRGEVAAEWELRPLVPEIKSSTWASELVRIECFTKGVFTFLETLYEPVDDPQPRWGCMSYDPQGSRGIIAAGDVSDEKSIRAWIGSIIGPNREISSHNLGKWAWGQSFSFEPRVWGERSGFHEPWQAMFEQQFSSLFAQVACVGQAQAEPIFAERAFTGYREWGYLTTPLQTPMPIRSGVPEDWDNDEFWASWRSMGEFGEILFDVWARDIDIWWLDTFRKAGQTIAVVKAGGSLRLSSEVELDKAISEVSKDPYGFEAVPTYSLAADLQANLMSHMRETQPLTLAEARELLYTGWPPSADYESFDRILATYLDKLDFFRKFEHFLEQHKMEVAIVPISGRTIWIPAT